MRFLALALLAILIAPVADARIHFHKPAAKRNASASSRANPVTTYNNSINNPRYAVLVMDADTGQILTQTNAREHRYPASLTKMMTLYLTFEALKTNHLRLDQDLVVSKKAASQPATNLAMHAGSRIQLETAIKAVVVRSANDVALALGETIGGSEYDFSVRMTNKARQLGMKDTVFKNANGLPDTRQYTTAYDLALLGRALRRDFPQYYHYFSVQNFTYAGHDYGGHNRVLNRLQGVDGIKTGFINASGFNLVSSLKINGVSLVAVVMGGYSWASRDNEMVNLLQKYYAIDWTMHHKKNQPQPAALETRAAPVETETVSPVGTPPEDAEAAPAAAEDAATITASASALPAPPSFSIGLAPPAAVTLPPVSIPMAASINPVPSASVATVNSALAKPAAGSAPATLDSQLSPRVPAPHPPIANQGPAFLGTDRNWAIQVGAFHSSQQAREAAQNAINQVTELTGAAITVSNEGTPSAEMHRARVVNLSRSSAEAACKKLNAKNASCFPLRVN